MNALERTIAAIAPVWGLRRTQARMTLDLVRKFDAAGNNRRTKGWRTDRASAAGETRYGNDVLRARARDLVNNNPFAGAALDKLAGYQVGTGIVPRSAIGDAELDKRVDQVWSDWADKADWTGRLDIYGLQLLAARCRIESGEALLHWQPLTARQARDRGMRIPLTLIVREPDWIMDTVPRAPSGSGYIAQGIEFAPDHTVSGYWLWDHHPGDPVLMSVGMRGRFVPASQILHVFADLRAGQIRGITEFRNVLLRLRILDDCEDAALEALRIQACLTAFVTSSTEVTRGPLSGRDNGDGERRQSMRPGMIERLLPGETVAFNSPPANNAFPPLARHTLHAIAEGLGMPYDVLTGDLSQANFASLRAGRLVFKRMTEVVQWTTLVPQMCEPVWARVMQMAQMIGLLPPRPDGYPVEWAPPRFEMLDPGAELKAMREGVRDGFWTWGQAVAQMGFEPNAQLAEVVKWNKQFDDGGVIFDTDPRRVAGASGAAQDVAQNAVIELASKIQS